MRTLSLVALLSLAAGAEEARWWKGNTHTHTVICGHADSSPEVVARWYLERDYNFLILSEHNFYIAPEDVALPEDRREDFILVPGQEVTGRKGVHSTAMNTKHIVPWAMDHRHPHGVIQAHTDATRKAHGIPILNHPNFQWALQAKDITPVKRLHLFELYNGHPSVNNMGDADHVSTEVMWDQMLSAGMLIYGVSSDDAHHFAKWGEKSSNPGRGWVMVRATELTPDAITNAMAAGDFYATSGVILSRVERKQGTLFLEVDEQATKRALQSEFLVGHVLADGKPGLRVDFIGQGGRVLATERDRTARFEVAKPDVGEEEPYVRAKVTWIVEEEERLVAYYAWTQPLFTDDREEAARAALAEWQAEDQRPEGF